MRTKANERFPYRHTNTSLVLMRILKAGQFMLKYVKSQNINGEQQCITLLFVHSAGLFNSLYAISDKSYTTAIYYTTQYFTFTRSEFPTSFSGFITPYFSAPRGIQFCYKSQCSNTVIVVMASYNNMEKVTLLPGGQ
jgi:hypothetical protein